MIHSHGGAIRAIGYSAPRDEIVMATEDGVLRAISPEGVESWIQPGRGDVDAATLSPDAGLALTAADGAMSVWRMSPGPEAKEIAIGGPFSTVCQSGDGRLALARDAGRGAHPGSAGGTMLCDTATGKQLAVPGFPKAYCDALALSRDGRSIAILTGPALAVWSLDPPREIHRFTVSRTGSPTASPVISINSDGSRVAINAGNNSLLIYRVSPTPGLICGIGGAPMTSAAFSGDGRIILTGSEDQTADVWNVDSGALITTLRGHGASVNAVAISEDGKFAVTGAGAAKFGNGVDNSVRVWSLPGGQLLTTISDHTARVRSLSISGDGQMIASAGDDRTVVLSDRATGQTLRALHTFHGPILSLSFDQTGKSLLVADNTLSHWDFTLAWRRREMEAAVAPIRERQLSAPLDARSLLSLGRWYAMTGEPDWAATLFEKARVDGAPPTPLELFQCEWSRGNVAEAERDLKLIPAPDAPAYQMKLWERTILLEKTAENSH
jgi:WD40 repeat protein